MSWQTRLREELRELGDRTAKLQAFNGSAVFKKMSNEQQILLVLQLRTMLTYLNILALRMEHGAITDSKA